MILLYFILTVVVALTGATVYPAANTVTLFVTLGSYNTDQISDAVCQAEASMFPVPSNAKVFAGGLIDDLLTGTYDSYQVVSRSGYVVNTIGGLRTGAPDTSEYAWVAFDDNPPDGYSSGRWGFSPGSLDSLPGSSGTCDLWTSTDTGKISNKKDLTGSIFDYACGFQLPLYCYYVTDSTPATRSPTPPSVGPTRSPVGAFDYYVVFPTIRTFSGGAFRDTNCEDAAAALGLQDVNRSRALIAGHMTGWDNSRTILNPQFEQVMSANEFRLNFDSWGRDENDNPRTLLSFGICGATDDLFSTGFKPGFGTDCESGSGGWCEYTDLDPNFDRTCQLWTGVGVTERIRCGVETNYCFSMCSTQMSHLCWWAPDIERPVPAPTPQFTVRPYAYVLFPTTTTRGSQAGGSDGICTDAATRLRLRDPSRAKVFVGGRVPGLNPRYTLIGPTKRIYGELGEYIVGRQKFGEDGFCADQYGTMWWGFLSNTLLPSPGNTCALWTEYTGQASMYDCSADTVVPDSTCNTRSYYMCYYEGDEVLATVYPAARTYTLFPSTQVVPSRNLPPETPTYSVIEGGKISREAECQLSAAILGLPRPDRARLFISGYLPSGMDPTYNVVGLNGYVIDTLGGFMSGPPNQAAFIAAEIQYAFWWGFNSSFGITDETCGNWTNSSLTGTVYDGFSDTFSSFACEGMSYRYMCYYETGEVADSASPTSAPTFPPVPPVYPAVNTVTLFLTNALYKGNQVSDANCQAEAYMFPDPSQAKVFASGLLGEINETFPIVSIDGTLITTLAAMQNLEYDILSLYDAGVCSGQYDEAWWGFDIPGLNAIGACNGWTSGSNTDAGFTRSCSDVGTLANRLCSTGYHLLCYYVMTDGISIGPTTSSPTKFPTAPTPPTTMGPSVSPTPPTFAPTLNYLPPNTYGIYAVRADRSRRQPIFSDEFCRTQIVGENRFQDAQSARALAPGHVDDWDDSFTVIGLHSGITINTALRFRTGLANYESFIGAGLGCDYIINGFAGDSFEQVDGDDCDGWTSTEASDRGFISWCGARIWHSFIGQNDLDGTFSVRCSDTRVAFVPTYLCYLTASATRAPTTNAPTPPTTFAPSAGPTTSTPTASPTRSSYLILFPTVNTYASSDVKDSNCEESAVAYGVKRYDLYGGSSPPGAFVQGKTDLLFRPGNGIEYAGNLLDVYLYDYTYIGKLDIFSNKRPQLPSKLCDSNDITYWTGQWDVQNTALAPYFSCENWGGTGTTNQGQRFLCSGRYYDTALCTTKAKHLCYLRGVGDLPYISPTKSPTYPTWLYQTSTYTLFTIDAVTLPQTIGTGWYFDVECSNKAALYGLRDPTRAVAFRGFTQFAYTTPTYMSSVWENTWAVNYVDGEPIFNSAADFRTTLVNDIAITTANFGPLAGNQVGKTFIVGECYMRNGFRIAQVVTFAGQTSRFDYVICPYDSKYTTYGVICIYKGDPTTASPTKLPTSLAPTTGIPSTSPSAAPTTTRPTQSPILGTRSPTTSQPTKTPTQPTNAPSMSPTTQRYPEYRIFATTTYHLGDDITDANCEASARTLGFQVPAATFAYIPQRVLSPRWDSTRHVAGPRGALIGNATDLLAPESTLRSYVLTLRAAGVGCDAGELMYYGMGGESTVAAYNPSLTCSEWTSTTGNARLVSCDAITWSSSVIGNCSTPRRHLCMYEGSVIPQGTTLLNSHIIFAADGNRQGNQRSLASCEREAAKYGFVGRIHLLTLDPAYVIPWNPLFSVRGPFGDFLAYTNDFVAGLPLAMSFSDAGICSGYAWSGFSDTDMNYGWWLYEDTCYWWTRTQDIGRGYRGKIFTCSATTNWRSQFEFCAAQFATLCVLTTAQVDTGRPSTSPTPPTPRPSNAPTLPTQSPTFSPTNSPTTSTPTVSPSVSAPTTSPTTSRPSSAPSTTRPTANPNTPGPTVTPFPYYTLFSTAKVFGPVIIGQQICETAAIELGLPEPSTARNWIMGTRGMFNMQRYSAASLELARTDTNGGWRLDRTRDVRGPTGLYITSAGNLMDQTAPMARSFAEAGIDCDTFWAGNTSFYVSADADPYINPSGTRNRTCNGWQSKNGYFAAVGSCKSKYTWNPNPTLADCAVETHHRLCYIDRTITHAETEAPTVPTNVASQMVVFLTKDKYPGANVTNANCRETAAYLGMPNPALAFAYVTGGALYSSIVGDNTKVYGTDGVYYGLGVSPVALCLPGWAGATTSPQASCYGWAFAGSNQNGTLGCGATAACSSLNPHVCAYPGLSVFTQSPNTLPTKKPTLAPTPQPIPTRRPSVSPTPPTFRILPPGETFPPYTIPPTPPTTVRPTTLRPSKTPTTSAPSRVPSQTPSRSPSRTPSKSPTRLSVGIYLSTPVQGNRVGDANCGSTGVALVAGGNFTFLLPDTYAVSTATLLVADSVVNFRLGNLAFTLNDAGLGCTRIWTGFTSSSFAAASRTCGLWSSNSSSIGGIAGDCDYRRSWAYAAVMPCTTVLPHLCITTGTLAPVRAPTRTRRPSVSPSRAPSVPPTIATVPPSVPVTVFLTNDTYQGNNVKNANCIQAAVALGFARPSDARVFVFGAPYNPLDPVKTISSDPATLGTLSSFTFPLGVTSCVTFWTGFYSRLGDSGEDGTSCNRWTSGDSVTSGTTAKCNDVSNPYWASTGVAKCSDSLPHLCYIRTAALPAATKSPTKLPTGPTTPTTSKAPTSLAPTTLEPTVAPALPTMSPTEMPTTRNPTRSPSNPPTTAPTPAYYILYATERSYPYSSYPLDDCTNRAGELGFRVEDASVVSNRLSVTNSADWISETDLFDLPVYGPTGVLISSSAVSMFSGAGALQVTLNDAKVQCTTNVWTGLVKGRSRYADYMGARCSSGNAICEMVGSCDSTTPEWIQAGLQRPDAYLQFLCLTRGIFFSSTVTSAPTPNITAATPAPTQSRVSTANRYTIYVTPAKYTASQVRDANCANSTFPGAWALVAESPHIAVWDDTFDVYSVQGRFIANARTFRNQDLRFETTLLDAGIGTCDEIWTGFESNSFASSAFRCGDWESSSGFGSYGSCDDPTGWSSFGRTTCADQLKHLCVYQGYVQNNAPTMPDNLPSPFAIPPRKAYTLFNVVVGGKTIIKREELTVQACQATALNKGYVNTQTAFPFLIEYRPVIQADSDIYGPNNVYLGRWNGENVATVRTAASTGLVCSTSGFTVADPYYRAWFNYPPQLDPPPYSFDPFNPTPINPYPSWSVSWKGCSYMVNCDGNPLLLPYFSGSDFCYRPLGEYILTMPGFCIIEQKFSNASTVIASRSAYLMFASAERVGIASIDDSLGDTRDSICVSRADELGLPRPDRAWALLAGSRRLLEWNDQYIVISLLNNRIITDAYNFRTRLRAFDRSFNDAGAGCDVSFPRTWGGFEPNTLTGQPFASCAGAGSRGISCTSLGFDNTAYIPCTATAQVMCVMDGADILTEIVLTEFPTRQPTTAFPTPAPTPRPTAVRYTLFATEKKFPSYRVADINCQEEAYNRGIPDPQTAWTFVTGAPQLQYWDDTKDVFSITGVYIAKAKSLRIAVSSALPNLTLAQAGVNCTVVWSGMSSIRNTNNQQLNTCSNWNLSPANAASVKGEATICVDKRLFGYRTFEPSVSMSIENIAYPCTTELQQLCVYGGLTPGPTVAPTPRPTTACDIPVVVLSSYSYTIDQCRIGFIRDLNNKHPDMTLTGLRYECAQNTTRRVFSGLETASFSTALQVTPLAIAQTWGPECKTIEIWFTIPFDTLPIGKYTLLKTNPDDITITLVVTDDQMGYFAVDVDTFGIGPVSLVKTSPTQFMIVYRSAGDAMMCWDGTCSTVAVVPTFPYSDSTTPPINTLMATVYSVSVYRDCLSESIIGELRTSMPYVNAGQNPVPLTVESNVRYILS